eukprot:1158548-Pelagomonas_calceolata.AAC.7
MFVLIWVGSVIHSTWIGTVPGPLCNCKNGACNKGICRILGAPAREAYCSSACVYDWGWVQAVSHGSGYGFTSNFIWDCCRQTDSLGSGLMDLPADSSGMAVLRSLGNAMRLSPFS